MPKIPTVALSALPMAGALGPMASENTANAVNQSIAQAGGALGQIATQIFNIAQKRQEHINKGILANEEVIFEKTQQQIMRNAEENRGKPETLMEMNRVTWDQYGTDRAKRATSQRYTREMIDGLNNRYSVGIERHNTMFAAKVQGIQIQQANSWIMGRAEQKASQGDIPGAFAELENMNVFPAEKADLKEKFALNDIVNKVNTQFNSIGQGSTSMQIQQYAQVANYFTDKDEKGNYTFDGYKDNNGETVGSLPLATRNQIESKAMSLLSQAKNQEMANIKPILEVFEKNGSKLGNQALQQSILAGNITQETADSYASIFSSEAARGERKRVKKGLPKLLTQEAKYQTLLNDVDKLTTEQVTRQVEAEGISPEQGKRLIGVINTNAMSQMDPENRLVTDRGLLYVGDDPRTFLQKYAKDNKDINKEGSIADKERLLKAINDAPMAVETKRRMTSQAIELFTIDFRESYKSPAPTKKGGFLSILHRGTKREIAPREADVRSLVYRNMRVLGDLGKPYTIDYLIQAERDITSHFENKQNGEMQHAALEKTLKDRLASFSGQAIVRENLFD